jgi:hypothetical protein
MSFLRVSNPVAVAFVIKDLGITIAASASNVVLSDQFSVDDLYLSANLEAAIIAGDLTVEIDYGTGFAGVAAIDYTNRDALAAFLNVFEITNQNNNERLVDGSDVTSLHIHDGRYHTEAELNGTGGAALIGTNQTGWTAISGATVQAALNSINTAFTSAVNLDSAYDNDSDGIMDIDGTTKPLRLRSNNVNDIYIERKSGVDIQSLVRSVVGSNEVQIGSLAVGGLAAILTRIMGNLTIDGNLTVVGSVTDTTVNELNVTNANIRLRDGATGIAQADASIVVERGTTGTDAALKWDATSNRWKAGLQGSEQTIALLEANENVTGIWKFTGAAAADPNMYLTDKAAAPTTNLGAAGEIPMAMITNVLAVYDKTNSRNRFLSVHREYMSFSGRDNANNSNEYARIGTFTSNQAGGRLMRNMTLTGISAQTNGAETWNVRVRKNGVVTNLATLALAAVSGAQGEFNVDFNAGDSVEVFIDGTQIDRPLVRLEFRQRF